MGRPPGLGIVLVGDNPASEIYVRNKVRAGSDSGLWVDLQRLPAGGQSTPMTYATEDGRQYVVMVAGGHGSVGTKPGDYVIAYTLPKE